MFSLVQTTLLFFLANPLYASSEYLTKVDISFCSKSVCYQLVVSDTDKVMGSDVFHFDRAIMNVVKAGKDQVTYHAMSGYYDINSDEVLLREVVQKNGSDLFIELSSGLEKLY